MTQVKLPDGSIAQFPDGMTAADIEAVLQREFASAAPAAEPSAQDRYTQSLESVRQTQFPQMNDQQWAEYSGKVFAPDIQTQAEQSGTLGFADEISSALGALGSQARQWTGGGGPGFGEAYNNLYALEQARLDLARQSNGPLGVAAEVAGGLAAAGPTQTLSTSLPNILATSVLSSGVLGGIYGYGTGNEDRIASAAQGAGVGTVVGRFGPTLANAASGAYQNIASLLARNSAARDVGISPGVARFVQETMTADDALSQNGMARILASGNEGMLADAGPSARRMLDTAIQSSGRAGQTARTAITERLGRDSQAIQDALNQSLGLPEGIASARARIAAETAGERGAAYTAAYGQPIDYSAPSGMLLEELLARVPQSAINRANQLMRIRGEESSQILAQVADDGAVTYLRQPDVRQIDYITRALNQEAEAGIGMGAMGGQTDIGSSLQSLSTDIRSVLGNHIPEYEYALNVAGDTIRTSQAVRLGADLLNPATTMDDVLRRVQGLSDAERQGVASGLRSQIDNILARVRRTLGNPDTEAREAQQALLRLSDRATRVKIEAALGEDLAAPLFAELDRAGHSFELAQSVADGSATFARQNQNARLQDLAGGNGPVETLMKGEPVNAGKRVVQALTGMSPDAIVRRQDILNEEIARLLVARGPEAVRNWQIMQALGQSTQQASAVAQALARGGAAGSVPVSNVATQRYLAAGQ